MTVPRSWLLRGGWESALRGVDVAGGLLGVVGTHERLARVERSLDEEGAVELGLGLLDVEADRLDAVTGLERQVGTRAVGSAVVLHVVHDAVEGDVEDVVPVRRLLQRCGRHCPAFCYGGFGSAALLVIWGKPQTSSKRDVGYYTEK